MKEILPFTFPTTGQSVRTLLVDGQPWFVAADVTDILGYANGRMAVGALPERMRGSVTIADGTPGNPNRTIISEPGVYRLVMRSNLLAAEAFQDWLAEEVVPSIRKTGTYLLPRRELTRLELIDLARESELARIEAENRAAYAECQMLELAPAARAWDEMTEASGDYAVREAAQILCRDSRIKTGQGRLFRYLREIGWLDQRNVPYQRHIEAGRVAIRARTYEHPHRCEDVATQQVRITVKGLGELHRMLGGQSQLQALMSEGVTAA